jgi:hypothetical protein
MLECALPQHRLRRRPPGRRLFAARLEISRQSQKRRAMRTRHRSLAHSRIVAGARSWSSSNRRSTILFAVRRKKPPCFSNGIVAESAGENPCGRRTAPAFRREIALPLKASGKWPAGEREPFSRLREKVAGVSRPDEGLGREGAPALRPTRPCGRPASARHPHPPRRCRSCPTRSSSRYGSCSCCRRAPRSRRQ